MRQLLCEIEHSPNDCDFSECVTITEVLDKAKQNHKNITFLLDYTDACDVLRECLKDETLFLQYIELSNPSIGAYEGAYFVSILDNGEIYIEGAINKNYEMKHESEVLFVGDNIDDYISTYSPNIYSDETYVIGLTCEDLGDA